MPISEQIDKISKRLVRLNQKDKKFAKRQHKRYLRRIRKLISKPNPLHSRYKGWIG